MNFYEVVPLNYFGEERETLTYSSREKLVTGQPVTVALRQKKVTGIVLAETGKPSFATKEISAIITDHAVISENYLELARWISDYYGASLTSVLQTIVPKTISKKRRTILPEQYICSSKPEHDLTNEQLQALKEISENENKPHLLFGVTGSGKTEVYLRLIEEALCNGKDAIYLVPEVSLTPQTFERLIDRFGDKVTILHSYLKETERFRNWQAVLEGEKKVVVGSRSALFAPCQNLGLIIIDEEHDPSYKQDQNPRYHAVKVAGKILELTEAKLVLGSATPSIETFYQTETGHYGISVMNNRIVQGSMPGVEIVDMRDEFKKHNYSVFSELLQEKIRQVLSKKKQVLLFLNRRGMSTFVNCRDCGYVAMCPNCDTALTFHYNSLRLICHHCNYSESVPTTCPDCHSLAIKFFGSGTQKVEQELIRIYGDKIRIARMDRDTTSKRDSHVLLFNSFAQKEIDILIGTQMITKGWDLPDVDLVGIVTADTMINFPDFSAAEKTFDLLTQVAGRTGRGYTPGEVVLQTYNPEHFAIKLAAKHDYLSFYKDELANRKELGYPPFGRLIKLVYNNSVQTKSEEAVRKLSDVVKKTFPKVSQTGPSPAFISKRDNEYRWQLLLKISSQKEQEFIKIVKELRKLTGEGWTMDVDPADTI